MTEKIDAVSAITRDLESLRARRRRHFAPALALAFVIVLGALVGFGPRSDLLEQPTWQLGVQIAAWLVCLVLFPAVGIGLWFPGRGGRALLAVGGVALAVVAALGVPLPAVETTTDAHGGGPCWMVLGGCGLVLLAIGALSGAFEQRRARSSAFWVAAGLALAALEAVTWICPSAQTRHVVSMHLGPAILVVLLAAGAGLLLHRRRQAP